MNELTDLRTTQQVAALLSISDVHVRRMVASGKAQPTTRVGKIYMFTLEEVEKLRHRPGRGRRPKHAG